MVDVKFLKDIIESKTGYRKIVLLIFFFQNDKGLLREIGFSERDINLLYLEFKKFLIEQHAEYFGYIRNEEESIIERFLNE